MLSRATQLPESLADTGCLKMGGVEGLIFMRRLSSSNNEGYPRRLSNLDLEWTMDMIPAHRAAKTTLRESPLVRGHLDSQFPAVSKRRPACGGLNLKAMAGDGISRRDTASLAGDRRTLLTLPTLTFVDAEEASV